MTHQEAVDFVLLALKQSDDPQEVSKALVEEAYRRGSQDNITGTQRALFRIRACTGNKHPSDSLTFSASTAVVCTLKTPTNDPTGEEEEEVSTIELSQEEEVRVIREELTEGTPPLH